MLNPDLLASLQKLSDQHERFLVISHVRPDGDAYGSTLGLALSLQAAGKDVQVVNADGLSPLFEFLPGSKSLTTTPSRRARTGPPDHRRRLCGPKAARLDFRALEAPARREHRSSRQQSRICEDQPDRRRIARHGAGALRDHHRVAMAPHRRRGRESLRGTHDRHGQFPLSPDHRANFRSRSPTRESGRRSDRSRRGLLPEFSRRAAVADRGGLQGHPLCQPRTASPGFA